MGACAFCGFGGLPAHLFTLPLNVLAGSKVFIQLCLMLNFYYWYQQRFFLAQHSSFLLLAVILSLILLVNSVSIVFIVQKFYWVKVETCLSLIGLMLSLTALVFSSKLIQYATLDQQFISMKVLLVLILICNGFNVFWSHRKTHDSVSNLYISNWGSGEVTVEMAELQSDF